MVVCGCGWVLVCPGVQGDLWVGAGVHGCGSGQKGGCRSVQGCAWVYACVWDEFSEFLLENRVPKSADFNTYPIRIFQVVFYNFYHITFYGTSALLF